MYNKEISDELEKYLLEDIDTPEDDAIWVWLLALILLGWGSNKSPKLDKLEKKVAKLDSKVNIIEKLLK